IRDFHVTGVQTCALPISKGSCRNSRRSFDDQGEQASNHSKEQTMRFMMLVIPKGYESAEPGTVPDDAEAVAKMMKYNEALQKARSEERRVGKESRCRCWA